ncbi:MAG: hypothetical protein IT318_12150 [Anaerolineales bacterium]|nr:hypothetical protein [Anaerolineales bacterium]
MSLEAILAAIETAGAAQVAQVQSDLAAQLRQLEAETAAGEAARRAAASGAAQAPIGEERAQLLHAARLAGLSLAGQARQRLVEAALGETRQRLAELRQQPGYARLLRHLIDDALAALGPEELATAAPKILVDARDEALAQTSLDANGTVPRAILEPSLDSWGGVSVRSGDGRIVIDNRLEARLERATPYLRRALAAAFERAASAEGAALSPALAC